MAENASSLGVAVPLDELAARRLVPVWFAWVGKKIFRPRSIPHQIHRIICVKSGALGDVILTTPLLIALRAHYPGARIDFVTSEYASVILKRNSAITNLIQIPNSWWNSWQVVFLIWRWLKLRRNQYDLVFVLDRTWKAGIAGRFLGKYAIGFDRLGEGFALDAVNPYGYEAHEVAPHDIETYIALGKYVGASPVTLQPTVPVQSFALPTTSRKRIAIAPGGARNVWQDMPQRRWPIESYKTLTRQLIHTGYEVIVLGGKDDIADAREIEKAANGHDMLNYTGKVTLAESGSILEQVDAAILHDSALLHVASATNTPTVALFGPTNPARKGPLSNDYRVLSAMRFCADCGRMPCVWESRALRCQPGVMMGEISVERVLGAAQDLLRDSSEKRVL